MSHVIYGCELKSVIVNTSVCDFEVYEDGTMKREYVGEFTHSQLDYFDEEFVDEEFLEKVKQTGLKYLNL